MRSEKPKAVLAKVGKITVKHFLNKNLKPIDHDRYPVYMTIWFQNKLTKTRSYWWSFVAGDAGVDDVEFSEFSFLTESDFETLRETNQGIFEAMQQEAFAVENIVRVYYQKFKRNIVNQSPGDIIQSSLLEISNIASDRFKDSLRLYFYSSDDVKVISARLMINWNDLSFVNIYDGLFILCNDGSKATKFYTEILSKFDANYRDLKLLYEFDERCKLRYWNWLDDPEAYGTRLYDFLSEKGLKDLEIKRIKDYCTEYLLAVRTA